LKVKISCDGAYFFIATSKMDQIKFVEINDFSKCATLNYL